MAAGTTAPADGSLSPAQGLWCKKFDWTQYPKFDAEATWSLPKGCTLSAKMMSGEWSGYENNPSGGYDMALGTTASSSTVGQVLPLHHSTASSPNRSTGSISLSWSATTLHPSRRATAGR